MTTRHSSAPIAEKNSRKLAPNWGLVTRVTILAIAANFANHRLFAQQTASVQVSATVVRAPNADAIASAVKRYVPIGREETSEMVAPTALLNGVAQVRPDTTATLDRAKGSRVVILEYSAN